MLGGSCWTFRSLATKCGIYFMSEMSPSVHLFSAAWDSNHEQHRDFVGTDCGMEVLSASDCHATASQVATSSRDSGPAEARLATAASHDGHPHGLLQPTILLLPARQGATPSAKRHTSGAAREGTCLFRPIQNRGPIGQSRSRRPVTVPSTDHVSTPRNSANHSKQGLSCLVPT